MRQAVWEIQLPSHMERFFQESGPASSLPGDERRAARLRVRTKCLLVPESPLPAIPRSLEPMGIFTCDISRHGFGFLSPFQFFPEEEVRIILPSMWLRATVARGRRLGPKCFQTGARLISKHEPSPEAFETIPIDYLVPA
jgi:hypothetical protein